MLDRNAREGIILGTRVTATSYADSASAVAQWASRRESRYVCVANVHSVMEAYDCPALQRAINDADLVTPDGMPLVWGLRRLGFRDATRVYGPDLTPAVLAIAEKTGIAVGFYGGSSQSATDRLVRMVRARFPNLTVAYSFSPPFAAVAPDESERIIKAINESGARILFVGLGAPKQDHWMAAHRGKVAAVMLGVGAAFDFLAGTKPQAPLWMRSSGLEWLFRLAAEPRRLWKRYLKNNPRFVVLFALQLAGLRRFGARAQSKAELKIGFD